MQPAIFVPVLVAFIAAGGTYAVSKRVNSGKIANSDATVLWAESQAIRKELREETVRLRNDLRERDAVIQKRERRIAELTRKLEMCEGKRHEATA